MRKRDGKLFSKISMSVCLFEEGWSLELFGLFIPIRLRYRPPRDIMESWGFTVSLAERTLHLSWGDWSKVLFFPNSWDHYKTTVLRADGTWVDQISEYGTEEYCDGRHVQKFDYTYTLKNGTVQKRTATVYVDRMEWRWRRLQWSPWPRLIRQSINVRFDDEVGERTGSWKGGTIGCGYTMLPGETAEQTLRRMERERVFN